MFALPPIDGARTLRRMKYQHAKKMPSVTVVSAVLAAATMTTSTEAVDNGAGLLFMGGPRVPHVAVDTSYAVSSAADVDGQNGDLTQQVFRLGVVVPLKERMTSGPSLGGAAQERAAQQAGNSAPQRPQRRSMLFATGGFEQRSIDSDTIVPDELYRVGLQVGYSERLDNGHMIGVLGGISSNSDKPFADTDVIGFNAMATWMIPSNGRNSWIATLQYDNQRSFYPTCHYPASPIAGQIMTNGPSCLVCRC